jgi:predicted metal-dependent hydrolase
MLALGPCVGFCFAGEVQFELPFTPRREPAHTEAVVRAGAKMLRLRFVRHRRARRYVLRLCADGGARVTIPRGGSDAEAKRFVERNAAWLERQLLRQAAQPVRATFWPLGTEILFRGERVRLEADGGAHSGRVRFGEERVCVPNLVGDLRPAVEWHLRNLAIRELPGRVAELAGLNQLMVRNVAVRNQRSRWGSCSRRGTVSLNWRLVQTPVFVRDYIILHELAHFKEMNHSRKFWNEVERMCPQYQKAERWLKQNSRALL